MNEMNRLRGNKYRKLNDSERRFFKRYGTIAVILASVLVVCFVMLISGQNAASQLEIEKFTAIDERFEADSKAYQNQLAISAEAGAQLAECESTVKALEAEIVGLNTDVDTALEAHAKDMPEKLADADSALSAKNAELVIAQSELSELAAAKTEIAGKIASIESEMSTLQRSRSSITRKTLTQYKNELAEHNKKLDSLKADESADKSAIDELTNLRDKLSNAIKTFEGAIADSQAENERLTAELTQPLKEELTEVNGKYDAVEARAASLTDEIAAITAERRETIETEASEFADITELKQKLAEATDALAQSETALAAAKENNERQAIEANRLRVLFSKADTDKGNIGISRAIAYVKLVITSWWFILPPLVALIALIALLVSKFSFFERISYSYKNVLRDESKVRIRKSATLILIIVLILAVSGVLTITGEYDRAGERLNEKAKRETAISDAQALVKRANSNIANYEELISHVSAEDFAGKNSLNSKQKNVFSKALKNAGLTEKQVVSGAEGRAENVEKLIEGIRKDGGSAYGDYENALAALDKANAIEPPSFISNLWSNFVRIIGTRLLSIILIAELVMLIAITCCACFKNRVSISGMLFNVNNYIIVTFCAFITIAPFFYVAGASFATEYELQVRPMFIIPQDFSLDAYRYIMSSNKILRSMGNSVFITVAGTMINLFFTMTMAYVLSKRYLHGRNFFLNMVIVSMFFSGGMVPGYILVSNWLKMKDTYWAVLIPGAISSYNLMIVKNFFQGLPQELEESARIDGCNELGTLLKIVLPLSLPVIATFGLFYAVGHWNSYFGAMIYMTGANEKWPLQVILREIIVLAEASAGDMAAMDPEFVEPPSQSIKMAVIVVSTVPIMCVYPFLQKYFVKGVMVGALKG